VARIAAADTVIRDDQHYAQVMYDYTLAHTAPRWLNDFW
jgi:hypothetical protein